MADNVAPFPFPPPFPAIVHRFDPAAKLCAYESGPTSTARHAIVFVGGLGDGPHTVPFVRTVVERLTAADAAYSVFEVRLRSSYAGFGFASLRADVRELCALVDYLRALGRQKIVLFGHSTGSQDCMQYAADGTPVDAFILQGPVSDREALSTLDPPVEKARLDAALALATTMIDSGRADDCVPTDVLNGMYSTPITAYRFRSLVAPGGDDDYFSSDLAPERVRSIWARFRQPVLVLHSEKDVHVPGFVSQQGLLQQWSACCPLISQLSGIIPQAGHAVPEKEAQEWLTDRVLRFLVEVGS